MTDTNPSLPVVGGMLARHVYEIIEDADQRLRPDGSLVVTINTCAEFDPEWQAAYQQVERELMAEMEACWTRHEHDDMPAYAWHALVIHAMADRAREVLGIRDAHPFWC